MAMQVPCASPARPEQLTLIWESEIVRRTDGRVELRAKEPKKHMSRREAAKVLGVSEWTVSDLHRHGLLRGHKPGARRVRRDGRASNAKLVLDAASVLEYDARVKAMEAARLEA